MTADRRSQRNAAAYLGIAGAQKAAAFVSLPAFAAVLEPSEYGQIAVLLTIYGLATVVLPAGLELPVLRSMFTPLADVDRDVRTTSLVTALFVSSLAAGCLLSGLVLVSPPMFGVRSGDLALYLLVSGLFTAGSLAPLTILRSNERLGAYATLTLVYTATQLLLRLALVVVEDGGIRGWILADLGAAGVALVLGLLWQGRYLSLRRSSRAEVHRGLAVGLPLVPHGLSHWGLNLSDRLVVAAFTTPALVGVYSMGYQIAFVAGLAVAEVSRAFAPRYGEASGGLTTRSALHSVVRQQAVLALGISAMVGIAGPQIVHVLLPASYAGAAELIPMFALGAGLLGLAYVPTNLLTIVHGRTGGLWRLTFAGAVVNIGLNLAFVDLWGLWVAAVNTVIGYLVLLVLVTRSAHRAGAVEGIDVRGLLPPLATLLLVAAVASAVAVIEGPAAFAGASAGVVAVAIIMWIEVRRSEPSVPGRRARIEAALHA